MGFPQRVKDDILVASARHCCVCRRFKGVKVEIHHIVPKEQGGKDSFDNAIPLCFDCHADAGHYFANHPKGTKFSPSELRKHKESWFNSVKENSIHIKNSNLLHARYLVTGEFDVIKRLCSGDLTDFPIPNCLLLPTPPLDICRKMLKNETYRNQEIQNILKIGPNEYANKYPDATKLEEENNEYKLFYHKRIPTIEDIKTNCTRDVVSNFLIQNGVHPKRIAQVWTRYEDECAGYGRFQELYLLRPLYFKYLVLTNLSEGYVELGNLLMLYQDDALFHKSEFTEDKEIKFPSVRVEPNQSVIVPLGMFLSGFDGLRADDDFVKIKEIRNDRTEVLNHGCVLSKEEDYFRANYLPTSVSYNINGLLYNQDIHEFDLNNLYWIDGYWNYGSCPHLFFTNNCRQVLYQGELFATQSNIASSYFFRTQETTKSFVIAELERETTVINFIKINDVTKASDIELSTGQSVELFVDEGDIVKIEGYYTTESKNYARLSAFDKYSLIDQFKKGYEYRRKVPTVRSFG